MGNFANNSITDVGKMLLADVQTGAVFVPTRIVIGSGSMSGGATTQGMTDVITPVKSLAINKKKRTPDGKCVFGGVYTNQEVTEPFYFRELALYAKAVYHNEDGSVKSEGAETLYSYGNAGATADYMPAYSSSTVVEKQMDLVVWVGNDAQVDLTISSGVYVTHEIFNVHASRHALGGADPITPADIGAVNKAGDTLSGKLTFENFNDYYALLKGRTLANGKTHFLTVGTGFDGGTALEHYTCDTEIFDSDKRDARLDLYSALINGTPNPDALVLRSSSTDGKSYRIYGEHYKPTAADVGAVNKAGDTMNGNLSISKSAPTMVLTEQSVGSGASIQLWNNQLLLASRNSSTDTSNARILILNNSTHVPDVAHALRISDRINNTETFYTVIHTGNLHLYGLAAVPASIE